MERNYPLFVIQEKPICNNCLKWEQFKESCHVFWEGKRFCSFKVRNQDEWAEEKRFIP